MAITSAAMARQRYQLLRFRRMQSLRMRQFRFQVMSGGTGVASDVKLTKISIICKQKKFEDLKNALNDAGVAGIHSHTGTWMWCPEGSDEVLSWC